MTMSHLRVQLLRPFSAERLDALEPLAAVVSGEGGFEGSRNITGGSLPSGGN